MKLLHVNFMLMAVKMPVFAALVLICSQPSWASNPERGRALYENQCESCHAEWAHARTNRKAKSLADLRLRATAWSTHGGLDWNSEEVNDVVEYLNVHFYHFK